MDKVRYIVSAFERNVTDLFLRHLQPLSLLFDPFESIILFLSVLMANYTMQDGRSNWRK